MSGLSVHGFMTIEEARSILESFERTGIARIENPNCEIVIHLKKQLEEIKQEAVTDIMTEDEDSAENLSIVSSDTRYTATPPANDPYWLSASFRKYLCQSKMR